MSTPARSTDGSERSVPPPTARLRARALALVLGLLGGVGLFLATIWLLIQGGQNVGEHLRRLGDYLPGYTVTWLGAVTGFGYGVLLGATVGWTIARIYNLVARRRSMNRAHEPSP